MRVSTVVVCMALFGPVSSVLAEPPPGCGSLPVLQLGGNLVQTYGNYPMAMGLSNATRLRFVAPSDGLFSFRLCSPSVAGMRLAVSEGCSSGSSGWWGNNSSGLSECAGGDSIVFPARAGDDLFVYVGNGIGNAQVQVANTGDPICGGASLAVGTQSISSSAGDPSTSIKWWTSPSSVDWSYAWHTSWHRFTAPQAGVYRITASRGRLASRPTVCGSNQHLVPSLEWNSYANSEGAQTTLTLAQGQSADVAFWEVDPVTVGTVDVSVVYFGGCLGDINIDRVVDGADLGSLLAFWGAVTSTTRAGDLNRDDLVDGIDLGILLARWGPCPN
jgi:hypothetical protein